MSESYDMDFNIEPVWHLPSESAPCSCPRADQLTPVFTLAVHLQLGRWGY